MILTSFKGQQSLLMNPLDLSIDFNLSTRELFRSYIELFTEYNFGTLLLNSTIVSVVTVLITLLFSIPGAYAVAKLRFPGREWLSSSVLLIYLIPAIILVIPLYAVFSQLGLRNSLLGLCIVYPATTIPVALYMLSDILPGCHLNLMMQVDGRPVSFTNNRQDCNATLYARNCFCGTICFMIAWNEFLFAFMFLDAIKFYFIER